MKVTTIAGLGIGTLFLLMGLVFWFLIPSYFFIIHSCTFTLDNRFSQTVKQTITQFGHEKCIKKSFGQLPLKALKAEFPSIGAINAAYHFGGKAQCKISSLRPIVMINERYLLMDNGHVCDRIFFACEATEHLPCITVKDDSNLQAATFFKECIKRIPLDLFELYTITWVDHTILELRDKRSPEFVMVAHHQTDFNKQLIHYYEQIKQQIMSQRSYAKKQWRIDVRFKNQIVVAQRDVGDS